MNKLLLALHGNKIILLLFLKFFQVFSPTSFKCVLFFTLGLLVNSSSEFSGCFFPSLVIIFHYIPKLKILGIYANSFLALVVLLYRKWFHY